MLPFFGRIIEGFASWCLDRGFTPAKVRRHLAGLRRLVPWFHCKHKQSPEDLSVDDITDAQHFYRNRMPLLVKAVLAFGEFLQANDCLKPAQSLRRIKRQGYWRYRELPVFGSIVDGYADWCLSRGFSVLTISGHLATFRLLLPWFRRKHKRSVDELTTDDVAGLRRVYRPRNRHFAGALRELGDFLKAQNRLKPSEPVPLTPSEVEVTRFAVYLRKDLGLAESTVNRHRLCVGRLLRFLDFDKQKTILSELKLTNIDRFLCEMSRHYSRRSMQLVIGTLRGFLGFQFIRGMLRQPLHRQIDAAQVYRQEHLPRTLSWSELQRLLRNMDRSTPLAMRDFTLLLMAASYGLRRSEVAALTLDDVNWRARTVRITQIKTRQFLLLPLTDEVAEALVEYLKRGRPASTDRHLFLRQHAPAGPLAASGVGECLERAVRATGVPIETTRFHAVRHAFALRLLRVGTPLKHISEVMGHRDLNSTSEYLRLDIEDLRQVALPVPRLGKNSGMGFGGGLQPSSVTSPSRKRRPPGSVTASASKGFGSFLAKPMQDFLALHHALGRQYQTQEWFLRNLDFFLAEHHPTGRVFNAVMFNGWVKEQAGVSPTTRCRSMRFLRKFCLYLARVAPKSFIPDPRTFPKEQPCQAPCLLSEGEVARLLKAALQKPRPVRGPEHPLRPHTMRLAVLLLYCCGLRRGELLKLRVADIDTERQMLRINQSKFHKSRLVPLSPSVNEELRKYLQRRRDYKTPIDPSVPLIWSGRPNQAGGAFTTTGLRLNWCQICRHAGVLNHRGRPARIHDLRHAFAVTVLQRAYEGGGDPQATLPRLARYMGHLGFEFTHYYLKLTEPLRVAVNDRFRRFLPANLVTPGCGNLRKGGAL
jgi:site-specific recombinase XerD